MKTFTRREYNLIHNALKNYELYMSEDDKKTSEIIMDKLYYFNADLLVDNNKKEEELSYVDSLLTTGISEDENLELPDLSNNLDNKPVIENGQYIPF